ncbi:ferredoxin [Clostridium folliculivorans]|uniref:Ferredoxin n=1 Tax=Clostridium folliculivorans TaxID=2886038 RepID=A0A9W5Y0R5_9CLOT|nr:ferredoxin [Clostridium folliculivorans]GKU24490.1 ferredoxin [Clostridium folliculivorans]GKU30588.1 ferredoxin [Clostridium folliculivorans]
MKACVDKETCIGCGLCAAISSEIFSMEDDGKAVAIGEEVLDSQLSDTEEAVGSCPVSAITLE